MKMKIFIGLLTFKVISLVRKMVTVILFTDYEFIFKKLKKNYFKENKKII